MLLKYGGLIPLLQKFHPEVNWSTKGLELSSIFLYLWIERVSLVGTKSQSWLLHIIAPIFLDKSDGKTQVLHQMKSSSLCQLSTPRDEIQ